MKNKLIATSLGILAVAGVIGAGALTKSSMGKNDNDHLPKDFSKYPQEQRDNIKNYLKTHDFFYVDDQGVENRHIKYKGEQWCNDQGTCGTDPTQL